MTSKLEPAVVARQLALQVRALGVQGARERRLPAELVELLLDHGLFQMGIPEVHGGNEQGVLSIMRAVEALAEADASTAWCVAQSTAASISTGLFPLKTVEQILMPTRGRVLFGGVLKPGGAATLDGNEFLLSGRWTLASASEYADWICLNAFVDEGGRYREVPGGTPEHHLFLVRRSDVQLVNTWDAVGMEATGSQDIIAENARVPAEHATSLSSPLRSHDSALYRFPTIALFGCMTTATMLGIARMAIDSFIELSAHKVPTGRSGTVLADFPSVQVEIARAEAEWGAARAHLYESVSVVWNHTIAATDPGKALTLMALSFPQSCSSCVNVVDRVFKLAGTTAIYNDHPLSKYLRDVHVAGQHGLVSWMNFEPLGKALLGR